MIEINANGTAFSGFMHDSIIGKIGRNDGVFIVAHRSLATDITEALRHTPQAVPVVFSVNHPINIIYFKDVSGEILAEIDGLPMTIYAAELSGV